MARIRNGMFGSIIHRVVMLASCNRKRGKRMICNITGKTCNCPICEHCEEPKQEDDGIATLVVVIIFGSLTIMTMGLLRFMGV